MQHERLQQMLQQARGIERMLLPITVTAVVISGTIHDVQCLKTTVPALSLFTLSLGIDRTKANQLRYDLYAHAIQTHRTVLKPSLK